MAETYFDTNLGELLIGEAAIAERMQQSPPGDLVNLVELLTTRDFSYEKGMYKKVDGRIWSDEQYISAGQWVLGLLKPQDEKPPPLVSEHIRRLAILGIMPHIAHIESRFETISNFKRIIGSPFGYDRVQYRDWDYLRIMQYIHEVRATLPEGQLVPTKNDYDYFFSEGKGPSYTFIRKHLGGIGRTNELLGHSNVREWEDSDSISFGVRVALANGIEMLTPQGIDALASEKMGPWRQFFIRRHGSWANYKALVSEELLASQQAHQDKLDRYRSNILDGTFPSDFHHLTDSELVRSGGIHELLTACHFSGGDEKKTALSFAPSKTLISDMRRNKPGLTAGTIETKAVMLGVFDDIWPMEFEDLRIPKVALKKIRDQINRRQREYTQRKRIA